MRHSKYFLHISSHKLFCETIRANFLSLHITQFLFLRIMVFNTFYSNLQWNCFKRRAVRTIFWYMYWWLLSTPVDPVSIFKLTNWLNSPDKMVFIPLSQLRIKLLYYPSPLILKCGFFEEKADEAWSQARLKASIFIIIFV